jgi:hypothetical protein
MFIVNLFDMLIAFNKPYGVFCQFTRPSQTHPTLAHFGLLDWTGTGGGQEPPGAPYDGGDWASNTAAAAGADWAIQTW